MDVLFEELSSSHRVRFLQELGANPRTASQLSKLTHISVQEGMRHLGRLSDLDLIEKRGDREYTLTPLGNLVVTLLPPFEAMLQDREFFLTHDLSFVPAHLRRSTLMLAPRHVGNESDNIYETERLMATCQRFCYRLSDQQFWFQPDLAELAKLSPSGAAWRGVYTPSVLTNKRFLGLADVLAPLYASRERAPDWRISTLPQAPCMLAVNEREAILFVRHRSGHLDFARMVRSADPVFVTWALALHQHFEAQATVAFDTSRGDKLSEWSERLNRAAELAVKGTSQ